LQEGTSFNVQSTRGNEYLGGSDFDRMIEDRVVNAFETNYGLDISSDPILLQQIGDLVERAKIELSSRESALVALPFIGGGGKPMHLRYSVTREELNELIEDLLEDTLSLTRQAMEDAGFEPGGIDHLVLAGGSTRIPLVRSRLKEELGLEEASLVNPDEIVAKGAAVFAAMLSEESPRFHLTDVTSHALGVEIDEDRYVTVLDRHARLPAEARRIFTTVTDNQTSVEINILQGDASRASRNRSLGRFMLSGIRGGRRGEPRIEVSFSVDSDGIAHVAARDVDTGAEQQVTVTTADEEELARNPRALQLRVASLVHRIQAVISQPGIYIDEQFRNEINELIEHARGLTGGDPGATSDKLRDYRLALEAVHTELETMTQEMEVGNEGA
jgi:molecular chaperone DnaK